MNKTILLVILSLITSISAFSAAEAKKEGFSRPYGIAGCGLGSVVIGKRSAQLFAATTNGTVGNQTFGITFGTLNCVDQPANEVAHRMDKFIIVNRDAVATDIARGDGETLAVLSGMMKCSDSTRIGTALQKNFTKIYSDPAFTPNEITDNIITVVESDPDLALNCKVSG